MLLAKTVAITESGTVGVNAWYIAKGHVETWYQYDPEGRLRSMRQTNCWTSELYEISLNKLFCPICNIC